MWNVGDVGCSGCGILGMWDVGDVGCSGCGMFGMWDVGCGMFAGMWDVDLQNAITFTTVVTRYPTSKRIKNAIPGKHFSEENELFSVS